MQDNLIERNNAWPAAMGKGDALSVDFVSALLAENSARIAALDADNAQLMGLVKEAGEALEVAATTLNKVEYATVLDREDGAEALGVCRATLAKIKEATDGQT